MNTTMYSLNRTRLTRPLFLTAILLLTAVLILLSHRTNPAEAAVPGYTDMIAFQSYRDIKSEIYVMNPDGSGQTRLTYNDAYEFSPTWSPDGTQIVFSSFRDGPGEIYIMNADGSDTTRLTYNAASDTSPAWSPDGTRIAFSRYLDRIYKIYVMNADGSDQTRLTNPPGTYGGGDLRASWSPDGTRIAFDSSRDGLHAIYVMNADGSDQTRLTYSAAGDKDPAWSPDGTQILFTRLDYPRTDIYVMNTDGSGLTNLTNYPANDGGGAWSPDGTQIVFSSYREGNYDIYVMNADGSGQTRLTYDEAMDSSPHWGRVKLGPISAPVVTASPGLSQVTLFWTEPFTAGHRGPLTYSVLYRQAGDPSWQSGPAGLSTLSTTISGLVFGNEYEFGVFATASDDISGELGTTTATLNGACPYLPGNLIQNYCFEEDTSPWNFFTDGAGIFTTSTADPYQGQFAAAAAIQKQGSNVQLYQKDIPLKPDTQYELSFAARSSNGSDLSAWLHKHGRPYTSYGLANFHVNLETGWNLYHTTFTTTGFSDPVNDARLRFYFGPFDAGNMSYHIDWVVLREVDSSNPPIPSDPPVIVPPAGQCSPTAGNLIANAGYESGTDEWTFWTDGAGFFDTINVDPYECAQNGRVTIGKPGSNVQLYQKDIVLQGGEAYQLRLTARSNGGQNVRLFLHKHDKPYTNYGLNGVELDLTSEWQVFVVEFTATGSVPLTDGRLRLWLAPFDEKGAVFEFDDVVLLPQSVVSAAAGTISALKTTALADQSATRQMTPTDWVPAHSVLVQGFFLDGDEQGRLEGGSVDKQKGASFCTNARPSRANLFPADGKMANINIVGLGRVKDLTITGITQDEEVIGPLPDAIINGRSVLLRKARDEDGEGRVYHVTFTATYHDNQTCSYDVVVGVPPDGKETAVDNGTQFDATIASP